MTACEAITRTAVDFEIPPTSKAEASKRAATEPTAMSESATKMMNGQGGTAY
jgi:hypothetical protein